ncbi:MAG: Type 1 glutamine amidotransferase-like domain-containing protein [Candidatus Aenigmarchaeota archaeon]|nr:Type 1 glutamine amidotransferase-like domain-containing protein [Candidatus Aenigmarchaeota archaeon]
MTDILLASDASSLVDKAIQKSKTKLKLAFIPTAADPYKDKWWIRADRKILTKKGFRLVTVDLKGMKKSNLLKKLNEFDIIYVAGGNTFYLLQKMRESGFDKIIKKLLRGGKIYVGSSAGAAVAGTNIRSIRFLDDPSKAKLKSFKGLNLVGFVPLPHFGNKKYSKPYTKVMEDLKKTGYKYVKIREGGAAFVKNGKVKMIKA